MAPETPEAHAVAEPLVEWFHRARREMPWRGERTPYRVWVAEVMLQQTRVETVTPYFERFVARFPDVASLAAASEDEVLRLWAGLGYYRRARNLWKAARVLVERHGGTLPADERALRSLPGVGAYTAGAIASLGFGLRVAAIDGNVLRVASRLLDLDTPVDLAPARKAVRAWVDACLARAAHPGEFNEALMELGATVCKPSSPRCPDCPISSVCRAHARGTVALRPVQRERRAPAVTRAVAAVVFDEAGRVFLRRASGPLFGGMWEVPWAMLDDGASHEDAVARALSLVPHPVQWTGRAAAVRHALSHRDLRVEAFAMRAVGGVMEEEPEGQGEAMRWVDPVRVGGEGASVLAVRLVRACLEGQRVTDAS